MEKKLLRPNKDFSLSAEISFRKEHQTGVITLSRPHALNALNISMIQEIRRHLDLWRMDPSVEMVILESTHHNPFCAGGDLKFLYRAISEEKWPEIEQFFRDEYSLNYLIRTYPKPYLSFINGIAMGGGLGLAVHGTFRILGNNVMIAMPETKLGFFPDVGASVFLNECPGKVGLYLGLTGISFSTADALYSKIGTHYVPSEQHNKLKEDLFSLPTKTTQTIQALLRSYEQQPPKKGALPDRQEEINRLFDAETVEQIFSHLNASKSPFAQETLAYLKERSPTSLKVTFELLRRGQHLTMKEAASLDFTLSQRFVRLPDFKEGIRATMIDKGKTPRWDPSDLSALSSEFIQGLFADLPCPLS